MATIVNKFGTALEAPNGVGGTTHTLTMPAHQAGDVLYVLLNIRGNNVAINPVGGWTPVGTISVVNARYYRVATTASESMTISLRANYVPIYHIFVIRGVDTANPIDSSSFAEIIVSSGSAQELSSPALTTVSPDDLIIYESNFDSRTYVPELGSVNFEMYNSTSAIMITSSVQSFSSGAQPGHTLRNTAYNTSLGGYMSAIAFKDDGNKNYNINAFDRPKLVIDYRTSVLTGKYFSQATYAWFTSAGGIAVHSANESAIDNNSYLASFIANGWVGRWDVLDSTKDLSSGILNMEIYGTNLNSRIGAGGNILVLADSSGNWVAFRVARQYTLAVNSILNIVSITPGTSAVFDSSGTVDLSAIKYIGNFHHRRASDTSGNGLTVSYIEHFSEPLKMTGGCALTPISPRSVGPPINGLFATLRAVTQGVGQMSGRIPLQIGDGVHKTYCDFSGTSIESLLPYDYQINSTILATTGVSDLTINASPDDVILCRNTISRANIPATFKIHPSSSLLATYDFSGRMFFGETVIWKTGVPCNKAIFSNCPEIDGKAAAFTDCTISASTGTHALALDAGGSCAGTSFTKGSDTYALKLRTAGSYNLEDATFSGYTNAIHVTAVSGTVTIALASGQTAPGYVSAGATVVFDAPGVPISITGMVKDSVLAIYKVSDGSEFLAPMTVDVTGEYSSSIAFAGNIPVKVVVRKATAPVKYLPYEYLGTITAYGFQLTVSQIPASVLN